MIERAKEWWEMKFTKDEPEEETPIQLNNCFKEKIPSKIKMRRRINTLEQENEMLKDTIKDELYKTFMEKLGEPQEIDRLRNDNKSLRKKVKTLKELLKEDHDGTRRDGSKTRASSRKAKKRS